MKETNGRMVNYIATCPVCKEQHKVTVNEFDLEEYMNPQRTRKVQDIFPYLSAEDRELLISGTCSSCFNALFGGNDDE